jgi:hypothetical protein
MRNETFQNGICIRAEIIDLDAGTYTLEVEGQVVESRPLTVEERERYAKPPLDLAGVAATLNAVLGLWTLTDAANAVGLTPEDLVAEAEAWAMARTEDN